MKTIKQIADEIGVSKTAVRKKMTNEVKTKFAETVSGVVFISEQGELLIKSAFLNKYQPETKFAVSSETLEKIPETSGRVSGPVSTLISMLQAELEMKNKQIEELTATIKIQAESINAANKNELAETIMDANKKLLEDAKSKNKPGIFKRLFKKNKPAN